MSLSAFNINPTSGLTGIGVAQPNTSVQFNDNGRFAGSIRFTFEPTTCSVALGSRVTATCGVHSFSVGGQICGTGANSISGGYQSCATGVNSIAVGNNARTRGEGGAAFGCNTLACARSISAGAVSRVTGVNSIGVGDRTCVCKNNSIGFGCRNRIDGGSDNVIVGGSNNLVLSQARESIIVGRYNSGGCYSATFNTDNDNRFSHTTVFGCNSIVSCYASFAMGRSTVANGIGAFAGGAGQFSFNGNGANTISGRDKLRAQGLASFAFGERTAVLASYCGNRGSASAMLGGRDNLIVSSVCNGAIIGGFRLCLNCSDYSNTMGVYSLALFTTPANSTSTNALVVDNQITGSKVRVNTSINGGNIYGGESNSGQNVGTGCGIFIGKGGLDLCFRSLYGGANMNLTQDALQNTVYINSEGQTNTGQNIGSGAGFYAGKSGTALQFRRLIGGTNTTITENVEDILIEGAGEANTASNLGNGRPLFVSKSGVDLRFKSLVQGSGVSLDDNGSQITINGGAGGGEANTASNLGGGAGIFTTKSGVNFPFRSINASTNISIGDSSTQLNLCACPAGGNRQVQFNNNGVFGASPNFCFYRICRSLTIGTRCSTTTEGQNSLAVGCNNTASGDNSFAQGCNVTASGFASSAIGTNNLSSARASHAEGVCTCASGEASHAEGNTTFAIGNFSHAEGVCTYAYGEASHSQGAFTKACGRGSHASGSGRSSDFIVAGGEGTFIHMGTSFSSSTDGAYGDYSAILGGGDNRIGVNVPRATIMGGNYIKMDNATNYTDTTGVGCLALFCTPQSSTSNCVLVWDSSDKKVKTAGSVDFGLEVTQYLMTPEGGLGHGARRSATLGRREIPIKATNANIPSDFISTTTNQQGVVLRRLVGFSDTISQGDPVVFYITIHGRFLNWIWMTNQQFTTSTSRSLVGSPQLINFGGDGHMAGLMFFENSFQINTVYDIRAAGAQSNASVEFGNNFTNTPLANQSDAPRPSNLENGRIDVLIFKVEA
jgi:hypothetical protein